MSRIRVRAEDVITVAAALALFLFLGAKSIGHMRLSEQNYWDFAFILMPVAALAHELEQAGARDYVERRVRETTACAEQELEYCEPSGPAGTALREHQGDTPRPW